MKKILSFALAFVMLAQFAYAQTTWTGSVSNQWNDGANWLPASIPAGFDDVIISTSASGLYPNISNSGQGCYSLSITSPAASVTVSAGGELLVTTTINNAGKIILNQNGAVVQLIATGVLTNQSGGSITINGILEAQDNIVNNGSITSGASGLLSLTNAAPSTISGGGTTSLTDVTFSGNATNAITTTNQVLVSRVARVQGFNVAANGKLRLTSNNATTTGMIFNAGAGVVQGSITAERSIDGTVNNSAGYRHYASPVAGATFANLQTAGPNAYVPYIVPTYAYNPFVASPNPFPNLFYYDESFVPAPVMAGSPAADVSFSYGWKCPAALTAALQATRGYSLRINASEKVVLEGTANTGNYSTAPLGRGPNTQSGYHLVGNPYPGPINAQAVSQANVYNATNNKGGFDASMYFFRSATGDGYTGTYEYINPTTGNSSNAKLTRFFPMMQGFFVRRTLPTSATVPAQAFLFKNAHRSASYSTAPALTPFYRAVASATSAGPSHTGVSLAITDTKTLLPDNAYVAFWDDATPGHDAPYDAVRPGDNIGYPTFYTVNTEAEMCAYNALPTATGTVTVPVGLHTLVAGHPYTVSIAQNELVAGTRLYLEDRSTGRAIELTRQPSYTFTAEQNAYEDRFFLRFEPATGLSQPATEQSAVEIYPNPAAKGGAMQVSANQLSGKMATVDLLDSFGRVVATREIPVREGLLAGEIPTAGLKAGVYVLRVSSEGSVTTRRLEVR